MSPSIVHGSLGANSPQVSSANVDRVGVVELRKRARELLRERMLPPHLREPPTSARCAKAIGWVHANMILACALSDAPEARILCRICYTESDLRRAGVEQAELASFVTKPMSGATYIFIVVFYPTILARILKSSNGVEARDLCRHLHQVCLRFDTANAGARHKPMILCSPCFAPSPCFMPVHQLASAVPLGSVPPSQMMNGCGE